MKKLMVIYFMMCFSLFMAKADEVQIVNPYNNRMHLYIYKDGEPHDLGILEAGNKTSIQIKPRNRNLNVQYDLLYDQECYKRDILEIQNYIEQREYDRQISAFAWGLLKELLSDTKIGKAIDYIEAFNSLKSLLENKTSLDDYLSDQLQNKIQSEIINSVETKVGKSFVSGLLAAISINEGQYPEQTNRMVHLTKLFNENTSYTYKIKDFYRLQKSNYIEISANYHYLNYVSYYGNKLTPYLNLSKETTPVSFSIIPNFYDLRFPLAAGYTPYYEYFDQNTQNPLGMSFAYFQIGMGVRRYLSSSLTFTYDFGYQKMFMKEWGSPFEEGDYWNRITNNKYQNFADKLFLDAEMSIHIKNVVILNFGGKWVPGLNETNDNGELIKYAKFNSWSLYAGLSIPITTSKVWDKK